METLLEVVTLPVSDPGRSLWFYRDQMGFVLDVDYEPIPNFRVVQLTPPGSCASIQFGIGLTDALPGSASGLYLITSDLNRFRDELLSRGVVVSDIRHKVTEAGWRGQFRAGIDPAHSDYASFADVVDPDGNSWTLQERGYR